MTRRFIVLKRDRDDLVIPAKSRKRAAAYTVPIVEIEDADAMPDSDVHEAAIRQVHGTVSSGQRFMVIDVTEISEIEAYQEPPPPVVLRPAKEDR